MGRAPIDAMLIGYRSRIAHFRQLFGLIEYGGLFSGRTFVEWLNEKRVTRCPGGCTLARMHADRVATSLWS
jgi:hypothetical protein